MHKYALRIDARTETESGYFLLTCRDVYGDDHANEPALYNTYIEARLMASTVEKVQGLRSDQIEIVCMEVSK